MIEVCGLTEHSTNPILLKELVGKLPAVWRMEWATFKKNHQIVSLSTFNEYLHDLAERAGSVIMMKPATSHASKSKHSDGQVRQHAAHTVMTTEKSKNSCIVCKDNEHEIQNCKKFKSMQPADRWSFVNKHKLCKRCLHNHRNKCAFDKVCNVNGCTRKHNYLLHNSNLHSDEPINNTPSSSNTTSSPKTQSTSMPIESQDESSSTKTDSYSNYVPSTSKMHATHYGTTQILSRVVPVVLFGKKLSVKTYAFLDEGSHVTMIDENLAKQLELKGPTVDLELQWTGGNTRTEINSLRTSFKISGIGNPKQYQMDDVYTVKSLELPRQSTPIDITKYEHLRDLPIKEYTNAKPQILIGADHVQLTSTLQLREGHRGEPVAAKTRIGWAIYGPYCSSGYNSPLFLGFHRIALRSPNDELHDMVKDFFSIENFGVACPTKLPESKEDERARTIMENTTRKVGNQYETGLLWRYENVKLPDSMPMAIRRCASLKNKMIREPDTAVILNNEISKYVQSGYAHKLSQTEIDDTNDRTWYLPVFSVKNPNKPEKTRIVWDAAAEVNKTSLNSALLPGPDLLSPLPDILLRFREYPIAISGDIREMFHQVKIRKSDQNSQRFLWPSLTDKPDIYVLTVMSFGACCSPSSAQFVKNKNAMLFQEECQEAVNEIVKNHYVDDWLSSFSNEEEAVKIIKDVVRIHAMGGFLIHKFISNSQNVLQQINGAAEHEPRNLNLGGEIEARVLGMWWSTTDDAFFYSLNVKRAGENIINGERAPTKREVLRVLMMIYDPLGLIGFFTVYMKIVLQKIWKCDTGWDDPIISEHYDMWLRWTKCLPLLENIRIPRCHFSETPISVQLHVMVDASENAFAAVAFFRVQNLNGIRCCLVSAKTKVAPLRPMSIPRLELQAAVLGTRLSKWILDSHTVKPRKVIYWSDSRNVLCWIRSENRRYRQFVAFRVSEILETTNANQWFWVPTNLNIADEATKWKGNPEISINSRWFEGPPFLLEPEEKWPIEENHPPPQELEEIMPIMLHVPTKTSTITPIATRFSKWMRLVRTQAYAMRFFDIARHKISPHNKDAIDPTEIANAENEIYRYAQQAIYAREIDQLKQDPNRALETSSFLFQLTPFLDDNNILRQRGRLSKDTSIPFDTRYPIIMPTDHWITFLLVRYYHEDADHQNHETVVNELRQRFVIFRLRGLLKKLRKKCNMCKLMSAKPRVPIMADHPVSRLATHTAPFTYTGIDLFGPLEVKVGRHVEKRWGVLFTCLTIRAIHIEIVHSLDFHSSIMSIRNFIARRGQPREIWTDNGTNFHGSNNELQRIWKENENDLQNTFVRIKWRFNPPAAPHMGGCWERLVKSVKRSIRHAMPERCPNDETLRCFLMEAESSINSRPLTYVPLDNESAEAITPNHLLLGSSGGAKPFGPCTDDVLILKHSWKISQRMADIFWHRWIREYLPDLSRRTKWYKRVKPIAKNDLVLIINENHRNEWQRAIVIETYPAKDGQVRQCLLKTANGTLKRPVTKLAILDVKDVDPDDSHQSRPGGECKK